MPTARALGRIAGRPVCIGLARASDSYLNVGAIVAAALGTGSALSATIQKRWPWPAGAGPA